MKTSVAVVCFLFTSLTSAEWTGESRSADLSWKSDPLCPYPSEDIVYFPYPYDCSKYWQCFEGNKYLYNCPAGLYWHEEISECDYQSNVNCITIPPTDRPTTGTPKTTTPPVTRETSSYRPSTADPLCPYPSDEITYFDYPGDCNKYWECYAGVKTKMSCPPGLYWHEEISQCDYPENVDCKY